MTPKYSSKLLELMFILIKCEYCTKQDQMGTRGMFNSRWLFSQKPPFYMLDRVLNMPLGTMLKSHFFLKNGNNNNKNNIKTMQAVNVEVHSAPKTPDLFRILANVEKKSVVHSSSLLNSFWSFSLLLISVSFKIAGRFSFNVGVVNMIVKWVKWMNTLRWFNIYFFSFMSLQWQFECGIVPLTLLQFHQLFIDLLV